MKDILATVRDAVAEQRLEAERKEAFPNLIDVTHRAPVSVNTDPGDEAVNPAVTNGHEVSICSCPRNSSSDVSSSRGDCVYSRPAVQAVSTGWDRTPRTCRHCSGYDTSAYQPRLIRGTSKLRFEHRLRSFHELCGEHAQTGLTRLQRVRKYFSRGIASLRMERSDKELMHDTRGLLTFGGHVQMNFLPERCIITCLCISLCFYNVLCFYQHLSNCKFLPICLLSRITERMPSDSTLDDAASFASAESFLSCDDTESDPPGAVMSSSLDQS